MMQPADQSQEQGKQPFKPNPCGGFWNADPALCMHRLHEVEPLEGLEMMDPSALNSLSLLFLKIREKQFQKIPCGGFWNADVHACPGSTRWSRWRGWR